MLAMSGGEGASLSRKDDDDDQSSRISHQEGISSFLERLLDRSLTLATLERDMGACSFFHRRLFNLCPPYAVPQLGDGH